MNRSQPTEGTMINKAAYDFTARVRDNVEPKIGYTTVAARPALQAEPKRNVHREPVADTPYRRFAIFETETLLYICEVEPTHRHPLNWGIEDGYTRGSVWAAAQASPKTTVLPSGERVEAFDQDVADRRAYARYCGVEASYSDAAFYVPLTFEAWKATGCPDPYTHRPYAEAV